MDLIRAIVAIAGIFVILPYIYGKLLSGIFGKCKISGIRIYTLGFMLELVVFYAMYLVMLRLNKGLFTLSKGYLAVSVAACVAMIVVAVIRLVKVRSDKKTGHADNKVQKNRSPHSGDKVQTDGVRRGSGGWLKRVASGTFRYVKRNPLIIVFAAIVLWELLQMIMYTEVAYSDDDTYSPMILDMVASGGFFGVDPDTGYQASEAYIPSVKYMITSWLPFQAFGALVSGVHPLIFTKTILPCALIILHYLIMWELAGVVLGGSLAGKVSSSDSNSDKRVIIMIIYALLLELGWSSLTTTLSYYFLTWLWYGKAFVQFITVPLIMAEALHMIFKNDKYVTGSDVASEADSTETDVASEADSTEKDVASDIDSTETADDREKSTRSASVVLGHLIILFIVIVAGCSASPMGFFLGGAEVGLLIVAYLIYRVISKRSEVDK